MPTAAHPSRAHLLAYAGLTLSTIGWAAAFIAGKIVLKEMTPLPVAAWRYVVAATVLLPFALRQPARADLPNAVGPLLVMIVCGGVLYPWLFLQSLSRTSATNAALLTALNPVMTLIFLTLTGEQLDRQRLGGVGLALGGAATVITRGDLSGLRALSFNTGDLLAVVAAACWAAFGLAARRVVLRLPPARANCLIYGIGGCALYALGRGEHPLAQLEAATPLALAGLAVLALGSSVMAGQLFLVGVRTVGVSRTVVFVYLVPVLTALAATALLGEPFLRTQGIGGAAVLAGVYWTTRSRPIS